MQENNQIQGVRVLPYGYCNQSGGSSDSDWVVSSGNIYNLTANIGIGTNNPREKLHIKDDDITTTGWLAEFESDDGPAILFNDSGEGHFWVVNTGGTGTDFYINYDGGGDTGNKFFIDNSGSIGIGTLVPEETKGFSDKVVRINSTFPSLQLGGTTGGVISLIDTY